VTYLRLLLVSAFIALCTGCASPAQVANMSVGPDQASAIPYSPELRHHVQIAEVNGGRETDPMYFSDIDGPDFATALELSLANAGLLGDRAAPYSLRVNLLGLDRPTIGLDFKVTLQVEYSLVKSDTHQVLWRQIILSPYTTGLGDAVVGVKRLRLANEGAARTSILTLLKRLGELKLKGGQVVVEGA
jgi:hypothetical protein